MKTTFKLTKYDGCRLPSGRRITGPRYRVMQFDDGIASCCWWQGSSAKDARAALKKAREDFAKMP